MGRKKQEETTTGVEGNELDAIRGNKPEKSVLHEMADLQKEHAKLQKAYTNLIAKSVVMSDKLDETKKQLSDLKKVLKAEYKDGKVDGFNAGYKAGCSDTRKQIIATVKGQ